jgi:DNA ligase (NAD+)
MNEIQLRIQKLRDLIEFQNDLYFKNQESNDIKDPLFDQLVRELESLEAQYPEYDDPNSPTHKIGGRPDNTLEEVEHKIPMLSLDKAMSWEEFDTWFRKMYNQGVREFILELKYDGLACSLLYDNGKFERGATRGDGLIGEDITATANLVPNIPKKVYNQELMEVRGEIVLLKSGLELINQKRIAAGEKPYKNVRNAASGLLRTKTPDPDISQYLRFGPYMLAQHGNKTISHKKDMDYLLTEGFRFFHDIIGRLVIDTTQFTNVNEALKYVKEKYFDAAEGLRAELDFDIDGIVCKCNLYTDQEKLGVKVRQPNWAIAYKFPAEEVITQIIGWDDLLGAKGNVTPRAILKPIKIGGTTVTKPTLHNYEEIKRLGIMVGDYVVVSRRGDVIPKIERVLTELRTGNETPIVAPTVCPECGAPLVKAGDFLRCENRSCPGRNFSKIMNFIRSMEIEEFGPTLVEKLVDAGKLNDLTDIYNLTTDDLANLERMGEKSAQKVIENIDKSRNNTLWKVIAGLTIKGVGGQTAKDLANEYENLTTFASTFEKELISMKDIGPVTVQNIMDWLNDDDNQAILDKLINIGIGQYVDEDYYEQYDPGQFNLNSAKFGFTGELPSMTRKEAEKAIIRQNGEVFGIKKGMDYLLIGEGAKEAKIEKAKKYGAKVITEKEFKEMIGE